MRPSVSDKSCGDDARQDLILSADLDQIRYQALLVASHISSCYVLLIHHMVDCSALVSRHMNVDLVLL